MEPNQASDLHKVKTLTSYSSTVVVLTSLLSAVIGGGTVFGLMLISKLGGTVPQSPIIDNTDTVVSSSTLPQGFDFPDRGRTSTVTYAEPDPEAFKNLAFPEYSTKAATTIPETVVIKLPSDLVSATYQQEFNLVVNTVLDIESHLSGGVSKSMMRVQAEAAAGRYLDMFEAMQQSKTENGTARILSQTLLDQLIAFDAAATQQADAEIRRLSNDVIISARLYADLNTKLMDQNDSVLVGSIPSQMQLDDIQATAVDIAKSAAVVALSIKNLSTYITQKTKQSS